MNSRTDQLRSTATSIFHRQFGRPTLMLGLAPGRVELLGNHTDYNRGLVLSAAIDRYTCVAAAPSDSTGCVRVWSETQASADQFQLPNVPPLPLGSWSNYVRGPVAALIDSGVAVRGFDAVVVGDVPLGGGLSSSASLECAVAMAVLALFGPGPGLQPGGMGLVELLRQAENRYAGVQCGVLDQFASLFGQAGCALFLDCDTLSHEVVPLASRPPAIVVIDSGAPRELAKGKYNERRGECEAASGFLHRLNPRMPTGEVRSLRDVPLQVFLQYQGLLDPTLARRVRHVLTENQRVRTGLELLRRSGDVAAVGQLMLESHRSSRDDFESSSAELDLLIDLASQQLGFLGGKLSGAGWGGCTVNLVEPRHAAAFTQAVCDEYRRRTGLAATALPCNAAQGAHAVRA